MSNATFEYTNESCNDESVAITYTESSNRCQLVVVLIAEEDGYSIVAANLPGVASQGDSEKEAIENIREAFVAAIETYNELGKSVPWLVDYEHEIEVIKEENRPNHTKVKWILVDVASAR